MNNKKEYIEREALKNRIHCTKEGLFFTAFKTYIDFDIVSKAVLQTPAADVAEVQYGEWVPYEQPIGVGYSIPDYKPTHYCSHCKGLGWEFYTICPHCGARMDGGKK